MKITIPEEYISRFPRERIWLNLKIKEGCVTKEYSKVFLCRWRDHSVLILNENTRTL